MPDYYSKSAEFATIIAAALSLFVVSFDMASINSILPYLTSYFSTNVKSIASILLFYYLALSGFIIIGGQLADKTGLNKVYCSGGGLFIAGALCVLYAHSIFILTVGRFIQGIGAALLLPLHGSLVKKIQFKQYMGRYFGIMTFVAGLAFSLGYIISGYAVLLNWRLLFCIEILLIIIGILCILRSYTDNCVSNISNNLFVSFTNFTLSFLALSLLTYLLNSLDRLTFGWVISSIAFYLVVIVILYYLNHNSIARCYEALNSKTYALIIFIVSAFIVNIIFDGFNLIIPYYLNSILKINPMYYGIALAIVPIASMLSGPVIGHYCDKMHISVFNKLSIWLLWLFATSAYLYCDRFLKLIEEQHVLWIVLIIMLSILGIAISMFFTVNMKSIMSFAKNNNWGLIASVKTSVSYFGGVVGFAVFANIFGSHSRGYLLSFKLCCALEILLTSGLLILLYSSHRLYKLIIT